MNSLNIRNSQNTEPPNPMQGDCYFNSTTQKMMGYTGTVWTEIKGGSSTNEVPYMLFGKLFTMERILETSEVSYLNTLEREKDLIVCDEDKHRTDFYEKIKPIYHLEKRRRTITKILDNSNE